MNHVKLDIDLILFQCVCLIIDLSDPDNDTFEPDILDRRIWDYDDDDAEVVIFDGYNLRTSTIVQRRQPNWSI